MKLIIWLSLFLVIRLSSGFISYPFVADNLLNKFLNTLETEESISIEHFSKGRLCNRECHRNDTKICHFYFGMKYFSIQSG